MTREAKQHQKKLTLTSLNFFRFLANLEQPGGRIPNTESAKVMFSVIATTTSKRTPEKPTDIKVKTPAPRWDDKFELPD